MSKQTALDWYWDKIKSHFEHDGELLETASFTFAIAKQKEREQMIGFADSYEEYAYNQSTQNRYIAPKTAEQYYNETYKGGEK